HQARPLHHARERSSGPSSPQVVLSCGSTGTTTASDRPPAASSTSPPAPTRPTPPSDPLPARSSTSRLHTGHRTTLSAPVRSALGPGRASPVPAATLSSVPRPLTPGSPSRLHLQDLH